MLLPYHSFNGEDQGIQVCIDEAGRGSWAGRLYVAAVIWNCELDDDYSRMIKDSKRLTPRMRLMLSEYIKDNAVDYAITFMDAQDIDELNILNATLECMHRALDAIDVKFDNIIIDGNRFNKYKDIPHQCIIGGDNKYTGIASASILAKVEHDQYMMEINQEFPQYDWKNNMGYGTSSHLNALQEFGPCKYHRMSFNPMKTMIEQRANPEGESDA